LDTDRSGAKLFGVGAGEIALVHLKGRIPATWKTDRKKSNRKAGRDNRGGIGVGQYLLLKPGFCSRRKTKEVQYGSRPGRLLSREPNSLTSKGGGGITLTPQNVKRRLYKKARGISHNPSGEQPKRDRPGGGARRLRRT